jgi:ribulose-5-phosphate 4-epimerase/fuculose-1-phosphate aldolase
MPDTHLAGVRGRVSEAEWQARLDCAAVYRLLAIYGMSDLVYNHVTLRVPGEGDRLLINPFGWLYEEVTASSLITINLEGGVMLNPHPDVGINPAGYVIHSAVHAVRPDAACVIHTHSRAGIAVSAMRCGLLPLSQTAMRCMPVAYHDYEGPAVDLDERGRLQRDLADRRFMLLRNHGLLTTGPSAAEAFNGMYWLEMACRAQVDAMAARAELIMPDAATVEHAVHQYQPGTRRPFGVLEWPAMLRLLDRRDPSWRD